MRMPKAHISINYVNGKYYFYKEYAFEGGGTYVVEAGPVVVETDPGLLARTIESQLSTPKPSIGLYEDPPDPKNPVYTLAGFRSQRAFDKGSAAFCIAEYDDCFEVLWNPIGGYPQKFYEETIQGTHTSAVAQWLIAHKAKYE